MATAVPPVLKSVSRYIVLAYGILLDRLGRPPAIIWIPATVVAAALVLPPAYLLLRATGAGADGWEILFRVRILQILGRTFLLVGAVTGASILLAVPLAWLTVRTDLALRRVWSVATALPLVIPSYVGGLIVIVALGPRGMLQQLLERLWGIDRLPDIYGFPGALLTLTFLSYPYVLLTVRAALLRMDPALEEGLSGFGTFSADHLFPGYPAAVKAIHRRWQSAGSIVHVKRLRGRLSASLRNLHLGHIPAVRLRVGPGPGRQPCHWCWWPLPWASWQGRH